MNIKDALGNAAIGVTAVTGFLNSTPSNTPSMDQVDDASQISQTRNEPSEGRRDVTSSGKP